MADYLAHVGHVRPGKPQQILQDAQRIHAVDVQRSAKHQVNHLAHFAGIAVFDRQHGAIAIARHHGVVSFLEVQKAHNLLFGENAAGSNVRERALYAAVGNAHALQKLALVCLGDIQHAVLQVNVVAADNRVGNVLRVLGRCVLFARDVFNGQAVCLFVERNVLDFAHARLEKLRNLGVNGVDVRPCFFQGLHVLILASVPVVRFVSCIFVHFHMKLLGFFHFYYNGHNMRSCAGAVLFRCLLLFWARGADAPRFRLCCGFFRGRCFVPIRFSQRDLS